MPESKTHLTTEDLLQLAKTAQINITEAEAEGLQEDLNTILAGVSKLADYADSEVVATVRPFLLKNITRKDEVKDVLTVSEALQNAPETEDNMFKVASILGGEQ